MFDYKDQLTFIRVNDFTIDGDADKLAELLQHEDESSCPEDCNFGPSLEGESTGSGFVVTFDANKPYDYEGTVTWSCSVDLSALDWEHPWDCQPILDAEKVYRQRRPRQQMEADAARWLRRCAAEGWALTPWEADKLMVAFIGHVQYKAEMGENTDPLAELIAEAIEDARPLPTGLPSLDAAIGGGLHIGLSVLAGDTGEGKSTLAIQVALHTANKRGQVMYAMCDEGGPKTVVKRMLACAARICGVEGCELDRFCAWSPREHYEAREAYERVTKGNVTLTGTKDVSDLLEELKTPASLVVLDFAQAMTFEGKPLAHDPEAASTAVRELREWAHRNNCVVLLLSAYSKSANDAHKRGAQPTTNDVLGSSELGYSSEAVLAISNDHKGTATVRDMKRRHSSGESCTLHLDDRHGLFS